MKAKDAVDKFKGNFWLEEEINITTEGKDFIRTVVIEFSSFEIAKKFFYSKEYQDAHSVLGNSVIRHHQIIEGS